MKRLPPLLLTLTLLVSCAPAGQPPEAAPAPTPEPVALREFLDGLNASRDTAGAPPDLGPYLDGYDPDAFTEAETDLLLSPYAPRPDTLTAERAAEDVETAFRLLRNVYAAYGWFGGDGVFGPLEASALAALAEEPAPTAEILGSVLADSLSPVLADGGFCLGSTAPAEGCGLFMYYVPGLYFTDLDGRDPDYVKPTVAPDGSIRYGYAALSRDGSDLPPELGAWTRAEETAFSDGRAFYETETAGLPALCLRRLYVDEEAISQSMELLRLASCGGEYRDAPLLLLDLRADPGGDDGPFRSWYEGFTGSELSLRAAWSYKCAPLTIEAAARDSACGGGFLTWLEDSRGGWTRSASEGARAAREGITFVLADKATAAAGESVVSGMRTVDNVVVVGSNTAGRTLTQSIRTFYLPNSGLPLTFGTGLFLEGAGTGREGVGILPDLWVNPPDAPDAVERLCAYYGLTR